MTTTLEQLTEQFLTLTGHTDLDLFLIAQSNNSPEESKLLQEYNSSRLQPKHVEQRLNSKAINEYELLLIMNYFPEVTEQHKELFENGMIEGLNVLETQLNEIKRDETKWIVKNSSLFFITSYVVGSMMLDMVVNGYDFLFESLPRVYQTSSVLGSTIGTTVFAIKSIFEKRKNYEQAIKEVFHKF